MEEAKGRLENAKAKVLEEEGMAKVDGELQGVKDQIQAHLEEEEERQERRWREEGGDDMEDDAFVEEAGSSGEVGVWVEVGKRRKVARQGRFSWGGWRREVGEVDVVEEASRQLRGLSEEGRERCMRSLLMASSLPSLMRFLVGRSHALLH